VRRRRAFLLVPLAIAVALAAGTIAVLATWPDVGGLRTANPESTAFIERFRAQRRASGQPDDIQRDWVSWDAISPHLKRAVVAAEDMEFFRHHGFSTAEMKAALRKALEQREAPRGASTITQQLAKNLWLSPSRNPLRKLREAMLTRQLERNLSKRRILELYLNVVEFGPGVYGAEAAARHFFGKAAAALTESEAAQLAAGLPRPRSWHPGAESTAYTRYVDEILRRMAVAEFLWRYVSTPTVLPPRPDSGLVLPDSLLLPPPLAPDSTTETPPPPASASAYRRTPVP
jgi:monofunctional biosynthetic peptidoglycan transglycosylase